ncbi:TPA: phosphoglycerate mutase family protein [Providencia stuartii]|uniref:phosphoglycerate mutase family protein n=1 Tax=Providencia stuartii TaxID=588 RepID=UPI002DBCA277|nr:phosphoglycerate mutase family protein [Providencia stuartii]WRV51457.1 phosphoglycerate mutase family protein [Providencia stuartii]
MALIYLYRHGEQSNETGLLPSNIPISEIATGKVNEWAELCPLAPDIIIVSSYLSSKQSGRPFINKGLCDRIQIWRVHPFLNISPKKLQKADKQQSHQLMTCYWEKLDPEYKDGKDAESFIDLIERVRECITLIAEQKDKKIVMISHESFLNAIRWLIKNKDTAINGKSMMDYYQFNQSHPIAYLKGFTLSIG